MRSAHRPARPGLVTSFVRSFPRILPDARDGNRSPQDGLFILVTLIVISREAARFVYSYSVYCSSAIGYLVPVLVVVYH